MTDTQVYRDYCKTFKGVAFDFKAEWGAERYMVGGKMFCMFGGDKAGTPIVTLKCNPADGLALREAHPGSVIPGYYMNKDHWNSIYYDGKLSEGEIKAQLLAAYSELVKSLPKKLQKELE